MSDTPPTRHSKSSKLVCDRPAVGNFSPQADHPTDRPGDRPANASRFKEVSDALFETVSSGLTITEAAVHTGINVNTIRNWISAGRQRPGGPYGEFVRALDAARASHGGEDVDESMGPVERRVDELIAGRDLDPEGEVHAAQARALARTVDALAANRSGSAGMALASVSRRLEECIAHLELQPKDAVTELQERHLARIRQVYGPDHDLLSDPVAGGKALS